ncbi:hypothetical protein [Portibacter lacus]|uniref:Uncharacterized protein n=1 Tax=Portibacter lacus TaxID=1099794 RepID=A0AA37ST98_9BACT|nr:hypothetical protein [Portibacter lacus]GLR19359.1 hypothetical protein GCM10007940_39750 [Portibacter lacus]
MINKLFLSCDNNNILTEIQHKIDSYSSINGIEIDSAAADFSEITKENHVNFLISNDSLEIKKIIKAIGPVTTAYACSEPNTDLLDELNSFHLLGIQRHLYLASDETKHLNLGKLKNSIHNAEPFVREGNLFICDFNVLRKSEVANLAFGNPSGLYSEDISQIFRYAGMNELNKWVILTNVDPEITDLVAQCIWYYAEAASIRFPDHPYFRNTVDEYVVDISSFDTQISFYKSKVSGRWWVKIPDIKENKWKSCSYDDYKQACEDNVSSELLEIISVAE